MTTIDELKQAYFEANDSPEWQTRFLYRMFQAARSSPDIPKEQDITKAFQVPTMTAVDEPSATMLNREMKRMALERLVLLAARTLCSVQKEKQPRSWVTTEECRRWERQFDDALFSLENAMEALRGVGG